MQLGPRLIASTGRPAGRQLAPSTCISRARRGEVSTPAEAGAGRGLLYGYSGAPGHDWPGHPECAARAPAILDALQAAGLTAEAQPRQLVSLRDFQPASMADVCEVHSPRYVEALHDYIKKTEKGGYVEQAPTYVTQTTFEDSLKAVGCAKALIDAVVLSSRTGGGPTTAFGICRPPGHHAIPLGPLGFCLLNTVAIAARHAQRAHGLQRVLIFDFDVHHGNGTQDCFVADPDVLVCGWHQAGAYPQTGRVTDVGEGDGEGTTINLPLPAGSDEAAVRQAWEEVVAPAAARFRPDIILVSSGFDAHWQDPLASMQLCSGTYHWLGAQITALADALTGGKSVFLLEGGYNLQALGESVAETFRGILGLPSQDGFDRSLLWEAPQAKVQRVLADARRIHQL